MLYDNASNVPNGKVIIEIKLKSGYLFKSLSIVKRKKNSFLNNIKYYLWYYNEKNTIWIRVCRLLFNR